MDNFATGEGIIKAGGVNPMKGKTTRFFTYINKKLDEKKVENHYYSAGDEKKGYGARWLDRLFMRGVVFILACISGIFILENSFAVLAAGLFLTTLYYIAEKRLDRRRISKGKEQLIRKEMIKRFCERVKEVDERGFLEVMMELFEKSGFFSELKMVCDQPGQPILVEGVFKGEKVGIYCSKVKGQENIKAEDLKRFVDVCIKRGLGRGIYVTDGHFNYCAKEYATGLSHFSLLLADIDGIYRGFLRKGLLFSRDEVENSIYSRVLDRSRTKENSIRKILSVKRTKIYITLGLLLLVYSYYVQYRFYYIFVSAILFSLGITAAIRWYMIKYKDYLEREISLDRHMA